MASKTQKQATLQDVYEVLAGNQLQGKDGLVREMRDVKKKLACVEEELADAKQERAEMKATMLAMQADVLKIKNKPSLIKAMKYVATAVGLIKPVM